MIGRQDLEQEINGVSTIKSITEIYQQISAISIIQVKNSVAKTRAFLEGVALVYGHAKQSYLKQAQTLISRKKDVGSLDFIRRNKKEVLIFVSSNQTLYGDLISKVFNKFIGDVKEKRVDSVVIGKVGRAMIDKENINSRVEFFDLADYKPEWTKIQDITDFINKYEKITIYYGEFLSILNQIPTKSNISGGNSLGNPVEVVKDYIFEPTAKQIMEFFETQVIANLFHQKIYEAQLARFASRLLIMNDATNNANQQLENLKGDFLKIKKFSKNKKQLSTFSSRVLWEA
ncbi:F0F1 ATP synthase subunit gamma [Patescibacteria group bacterium]|nr:F0F1 ATP synthase subunit gamma [Patescibacteria group bacterium]